MILFQIDENDWYTVVRENNVPNAINELWKSKYINKIIIFILIFTILFLLLHICLRQVTLTFFLLRPLYDEHFIFQ